MSEKQPWWHLGEMRPGFKKVTGAASLLIVAFFALLLMIPTQSDEARTEIVKPHVRTAAPVPDKVEESGPIEVAIDFEHEMDSRGRLRIVGETNLPEETALGIGLERKVLNFREQVVGAVENGRFESSWISYRGAPLPAGVYKADVEVMYHEGQPKSVIRRLGNHLRYMTGPLVVRHPDLPFMGLTALAERPVEVLDGPRVAEVEVRPQPKQVLYHDYWSDPGRHFTIADLSYALSPVQGVLTISGRIKNIGPRDARYVNVKVSMRDARGREVGRSNVIKDDRFKSGESWWFDGLLTVRKPGGVELYVGPESITAFGS